MKSILFVDDHEVLARLSCEILEMQGYKAVAAYTALDALRKFDQQAFDLVVTDFRMVDMNGLDLARRIRMRNPDIPVIIVTGYGPIEADHVNDCLSKDELYPKLIERIRIILGSVSDEAPAPPAPTALGRLGAD